MRDALGEIATQAVSDPQKLDDRHAGPIFSRAAEMEDEAAAKIDAALSGR